MSKTKLTASDWELVKNAPYWVNQMLAEADGRVSFFTKRREGKALDQAIAGYKTQNELVNDIIADSSDAPSEIGKASQADAEKALKRIATIVDEKLGSDDLAALKDFLTKVGHQVALSSKEGGAGNAKMVSEKEADALTRLESAMKVTSAYATAHVPDSPKPAAKPSAYAKPAPTPAQRDDAKAKQQADAKAREEAAKKQTEARERLEKARADAEAKAEAKKKEEAKERLDKARAEAEQRQSEAKEAKAKAEAEAAKAKEEAARKEAEAKAAASAPQYTQFIAEHTVQPGDNLSFISERYYGTQANFRIIYKANREVIGDNMNLIRPGQVLKIPKL